MKIICGLGNPGQNYENTRHNAGFIFLDELAKAFNSSEFKVKKEWNLALAECGSGDDKILLVKPLTYMNKSGEALSLLSNFYKVGPGDIILIFDDVDLPLGTVRFRKQGSAGTHNGMKSVISHLGTQDFPRLRLGIESRTNKLMPLDAFVLSPFKNEERKVFDAEVNEGIGILKNSLAI